MNRENINSHIPRVVKSLKFLNTSISGDFDSDEKHFESNNSSNLSLPNDPHLLVSSARICHTHSLSTPKNINRLDAVH